MNAKLYIMPLYIVLLSVSLDPVRLHEVSNGYKPGGDQIFYHFVCASRRYDDLEASLFNRNSSHIWTLLEGTSFCML